MTEYSIRARMKTYVPDIERVVYSVYARTDGEEEICVNVLTSDIGIAAVEAAVLLKKMRIRAYIVLVESEHDSRELGVLSREVLDRLCDENLPLAACFISIADMSHPEDDINYAERALAKYEKKAFGGVELTPEKILEIHEYIWDSHLFIECTGMSHEESLELKRCAMCDDPYTLLYHTYLMSLWGWYDVMLPHTLYTAIKYGTFIGHFGDYPMLKRLIFYN